MINLDKINIELPNHIDTLEKDLAEATMKIGNATYRSKRYYNNIKIAQDIKRQIEVNKKVANIIGVNYGVQAKTLEASKKSYRPHSLR